MTTLLHSAVAVDARGETPDSWLLFDGGVIALAGVGPERPEADVTVDLSGRWIAPGFIDLHAHGGGGEDFATGALVAALRAHRRHGTTRSIVSLVSEPIPKLLEQLSLVADLTVLDPLVFGSHLEGPFLAPGRRGAHAEHTLRLPDPVLIDELLAAARGTLRQVTIAPELPGALDAIQQFVAAGVIVAVGHTEADFLTATAAFDAGATLMTHTFNAMPGVQHRDPGPIVAAIRDPRVGLELILDGRHVDVNVASLLFAVAPSRVALITDAMAAAGAPDGNYHLGSLEVSVRGGVATVAGIDTIAGSTLTQDAAFRMAHLGMGLPRPAAIGALTATPARILGVADRFGLLAPGYVADVTVFGEAALEQVWAAGEQVG